MTFIEAFKSLIAATPRYATWRRDNLNCPYGNFIMDSKNCYMCFDVVRLEDSYYCDYTYDSLSSVDTSYSERCELCYDCVDCFSCFNVDHCQECSECYDLQYCYDCKGCKNCFGCVGLRHKEFHIFNTPYDKESYKQEIQRLRKTEKEVLDRFESLKKTVPRKYMHEINAENCFGDYVRNCKNIYYGFDVSKKVEDSGYLYDCLENLQDCYDCFWVGGYEGGGLMYESLCIGQCYNCNFCLMSRLSKDSEFLYECINCDHCFMCAYIRNKKYHILNQAYAKEEYERKVAEIKTELKQKNMYGLDLFLYVGAKA